MSNVVRILVIDEDKNWRNLIKDIFKKDFYEIIEAEFVDLAINYISTEIFDTIILELKFSDDSFDKLKGFEVQEIVKKNAPTTPIIFLSAFDNASKKIEAITRGAFFFIEKLDKGVVKELIKQKVQEAIEKKRKDDEEYFDKLILKKIPSFMSEICFDLKTSLEPYEIFRRQIDLYQYTLIFASIVVISDYLAGIKRFDDINLKIDRLRNINGGGQWLDLTKCIYYKRNEFRDHFFIKIFSDFFSHKNLELLENLKRIRNIKHAHSPLLPRNTYKDLSQRCYPILKELLSKLEFFNDSMLCKVLHIKNLRFIEKKFHKLEKCIGNYSKIPTDEILFNTLLPCEELLLINLKDENFVSLHPFVIFDVCPKCNNLELFYFNGFTKNEINFSSFKTDHCFSTDQFNNFLFKLLNWK